MPFHASIASAKGAVEGLTRSLAAEYASSSIRFNAIAPSLTNTPLAERLLNTPEKQQSSAARHPLGRFGEADDVAALPLRLLLLNFSYNSQLFISQCLMGALFLFTSSHIFKSMPQFMTAYVNRIHSS
jgi:NAD(P)-dependent dehydrogenase (short-subunit alcohol dehydrogenase family)